MFNRNTTRCFAQHPSQIRNVPGETYQGERTKMSRRCLAELVSRRASVCSPTLVGGWSLLIIIIKMATIAEELMNEALSEKKDNHDRSFNVYRTARHQRGGRWRAPQHSAVDYMGRKTTGREGTCQCVKVLALAITQRRESYTNCCPVTARTRTYRNC